MDPALGKLANIGWDADKDEIEKAAQKVLIDAKVDMATVQTVVSSRRAKCSTADVQFDCAASLSKAK
eukprot:8329800-Karenia_brevis.AAC.1